jgi:hypothetical protein
MGGWGDGEMGGWGNGERELYIGCIDYNLIGFRTVKRDESIENRLF